MERSTKEAWLTGPGDLKEDDVLDVPVPGASVRVRGLPARYSAEIQGQMKLTTDGRDQVARIDVAAMERLQFVHGCIDPVFNEVEANQIQEKYGPAFRKVIAKIDELSGIDKDAIEKTEQRFQAGGTEAPGGVVDDGTPAGGNGSDLHVRTGA
jgi:hypothetical protein